MKSWVIGVIIVLIVFIILGGVYFLTGLKQSTKQYYCKTGSDCVSSCSQGCVNTEWAKTIKNDCQNIRAWDCSCVNNVCYTDGKPRSK
jgi:hypothetical protein